MEISTKLSTVWSHRAAAATILAGVLLLWPTWLLLSAARFAMDHLLDASLAETNAALDLAISLLTIVFGVWLARRPSGAATGGALAMSAVVTIVALSQRPAYFGPALPAAVVGAVAVLLVLTTLRARAEID